MAEARKILLMIRKFHLEGKYWDVQLQIDDEVFNCQRSLLAANFVYFDTMFSSSNFEESDARRNQPIILHKIDAEAFKELLQFIYTGDICVIDSNVHHLLFMHDFLQLRRGRRVKKKCLAHVKNRSKQNVPLPHALELLCFACLKQKNVLVDTLRAHICRHLHYYSKDARLIEISFEILSALLEFSKNYIIPVRGSADVLLKIVHNWINHNREGRGQYHSNLLKNIDFENVSSNFSRSLINRLQNALNEVNNPSKDNELHSESNMLATVMETNLTDGDVQLDGIISHNFENVREMRSGVQKLYYSPSRTISGLSWKIGVLSTIQDLSVYLYCDGTDLKTEWNCYATFIFTAKSHKDGRKDIMRKINNRYLFSSNKNPSAWGVPQFLEWDTLVDPENGYINDDGSISVNAHVYADVPFLKMM